MSYQCVFAEPPHRLSTDTADV